MPFCLVGHRGLRQSPGLTKHRGRQGPRPHHPRHATAFGAPARLHAGPRGDARARLVRRGGAGRARAAPVDTGTQRQNPKAG